MKKEKPPSLFLAIDPGATCGFGWKLRSDPEIYHGSVALAAIGDRLERIGTLGTGYRHSFMNIVAFIERSTTKKPWYRAHRADANKCADAIKKLWPRRNKIYFIDPRTWQKGMLKNAPGLNTKQQSLFVASLILKTEITDTDAADAVCILEFGMKNLLAEGE